MPTIITDHTGQKLIVFSHFKLKNAKQIVKFFDLKLLKGVCYAAGAMAYMIHSNSEESSDVIFMRDPISESKVWDDWPNYHRRRDDSVD